MEDDVVVACHTFDVAPPRSHTPDLDAESRPSACSLSGAFVASCIHVACAVLHRKQLIALYHGVFAILFLGAGTLQFTTHWSFKIYCEMCATMIGLDFPRPAHSSLQLQPLIPLFVSVCCYSCLLI
eukprot:Gregarina_sp_Pseudo_9__3952@NODE_409_length_2897_cov_306_254724_g386_i0_p4_GENE_NODE_409_length_2897_cov_306_254724_g386_i0NODE_409_length_2897_cov_306_254724_g386_i0_p4_ORF_typecomplete_len126_score2_31_NODE_409_length_2897_cov_306_254724_g386_i015711948